MIANTENFQMLIYSCVSWNSQYLDYFFYTLFRLFKSNDLYIGSWKYWSLDTAV